MNKLDKSSSGINKTSFFSRVSSKVGEIKNKVTSLVNLDNNYGDKFKDVVRSIPLAVSALVASAPVEAYNTTPIDNVAPISIPNPSLAKPFVDLNEWKETPNPVDKVMGIYEIKGQQYTLKNPALSPNNYVYLFDSNGNKVPIIKSNGQEYNGSITSVSDDFSSFTRFGNYNKDGKVFYRDFLYTGANNVIDGTKSKMNPYSIINNFNTVSIGQIKSDKTINLVGNSVNPDLDGQKIDKMLPAIIKGIVSKKGQISVGETILIQEELADGTQKSIEDLTDYTDYILGTGLGENKDGIYKINTDTGEAVKLFNFPSSKIGVVDNKNGYIRVVGSNLEIKTPYFYTQIPLHLLDDSNTIAGLELAVSNLPPMNRTIYLDKNLNFQTNSIQNFGVNPHYPKQTLDLKYSGPLNISLDGNDINVGQSSNFTTETREKAILEIIRDVDFAKIVFKQTILFTGSSNPNDFKSTAPTLKLNSLLNIPFNSDVEIKNGQNTYGAIGIPEITPKQETPMLIKPTTGSSFTIDGSGAMVVIGSHSIGDVLGYLVAYEDSGKKINYKGELKDAIGVKFTKKIIYGGEIEPLDKIAPVLSSTSKTFTTTVGTPLTLKTVTANDEVEGAVTVIQTGAVNFNTVGTYKIIYTAKDSKNNTSSITHTYVVNALPDTTAPVLSSTSQTFTTTVGTALPLVTVTANDAVEGAVTVTQTGAANFNTVGTYTVFYTAKDSKNNISSITHTYVVNALLLNRTELDQVIAQVALLNEADYTQGSWINISLNSMPLPERTQSEIDSKVIAITEAIAALITQSSIDILNELLGESYGLFQADYTADSWSALLSARALFEYKQSDINFKIEALTKAINGLVLDKTVINTLKAQVSLLVESEYTPETWLNIVTALALPELNIDQINIKIMAIFDAIDLLVKIVVLDTTALNALEAQAQSLVESQYTVVSWSALQVARSMAQGTQAQIDAKTTAMQAGINGLVLVGGVEVDTTPPSKLSENFPDMEWSGNPFSGTMTFSENIAEVVSIKIINELGFEDSTASVTSGIGTSILTISGVLPSFTSRIILVVKDSAGNTSTVESNLYSPF